MSGQVRVHVHDYNLQQHLHSCCITSLLCHHYITLFPPIPSTTNVKKWESEMQTLKNNNTRLKNALEESSQHVTQWKMQLQKYKEENDSLKLKVVWTAFFRHLHVHVRIPVILREQVSRATTILSKLWHKYLELCPKFFGGKYYFRHSRKQDP